MPGRNRVTINCVAREAGVSPPTVSRVINDRPDVAPKTRQRVREVIARLGFQPSNAARSLSLGQSCTLGVVSYGLEYFGPAHTLSGVERGANDLGYTVLLSLMRAPQNNGAQVLRDLLAHHVDGVIWAVPEIGNNRGWIFEETSRLSIPLVFIDTQPHPSLSVVNVDNRGGGRAATKHLLEQGYREIGLITGPLDWWAARERKLGWCDALQEAGFAIQEGLMVEGDWSAASGERGLGRLLERHPGIEALFACNDQMALGALKVARQMGRRVPDDLAIVGFDDIPEAAHFYPALTTVRQSLGELGGCAVRELDRLVQAIRRDDGDARPETLLLEPELIVRGSTLVNKVTVRTT